jgi:hypothetical protein
VRYFIRAPIQITQVINLNGQNWKRVECQKNRVRFLGTIFGIGRTKINRALNLSGLWYLASPTTASSASDDTVDRRRGFRPHGPSLAPAGLARLGPLSIELSRQTRKPHDKVSTDQHNSGKIRNQPLSQAGRTAAGRLSGLRPRGTTTPSCLCQWLITWLFCLTSDVSTGRQRPVRNVRSALDLISEGVWVAASCL